VNVWGGTLLLEERDIRGWRAIEWRDRGYSWAAIGEGLYLAGHGEDPADYINHSCDPNVWMRDEVTLVARRDIAVGEELTIDYALFEETEEWTAPWTCRCGSEHCRGEHSGRAWRRKDLQERYAGHFSPFINERIRATRLLEWVERELAPAPCSSAQFIYDDMDSQSGRSLPIVYVPFDAGQKGHWRDRGSAFDYVCATKAEGGRVLDFGPGDGWPTLIVAPYVREVVGVDGSRRRVQVCAENAARLGTPNARFVHVPPGEALPFADAHFDAVMASSSVEQTPDPRSTLRELCRVLRPGGRLRVDYESLSGYRHGRERDLWLCSIAEARCKLVLLNRDIPGERVCQYGLTFAMPGQALTKALAGETSALSLDVVTVQGLEALRSAIVDVRVCTTIHPSGPTLASWLREIGFRAILPSHSGARFAGEMFDGLAEQERPADMAGVDALLEPIVRAVVSMPAPIKTDPMITAIK
jgi:2-polyprenyl-3-methyl-5-hydroxy-6-metoxy-1,4-benzoquinol methylase